MSKGHHRHLIRALLLLVGAVFVFFVARAFLIPETFGQYGHFRGENLEEQARLPAVHGSPDSCGECHEATSGVKASGGHNTVPCQDCHGPLSRHITEEGMGPMPVQRDHALCARCHQMLEARPKTFPQIDLHGHVFSKGKNLESEGVCLNCHPPHHPLGKR